MVDSKKTLTITLESEHLERVKKLVRSVVADVGWYQAYVDLVAAVQLMEGSAKGD